MTDVHLMFILHSLLVWYSSDCVCVCVCLKCVFFVLLLSVVMSWRLCFPVPGIAFAIVVHRINKSNEEKKKKAAAGNGDSEQML